MDKFLEEFYELLNKYNAEIDFVGETSFIRIYTDSVNEEEIRMPPYLNANNLRPKI